MYKSSSNTKATNCTKLSQSDNLIGRVMSPASIMKLLQLLITCHMSWYKPIFMSDFDSWSWRFDIIIIISGFMKATFVLTFWMCWPRTWCLVQCHHIICILHLSLYQHSALLRYNLISCNGNMITTIGTNMLECWCWCWAGPRSNKTKVWRLKIKVTDKD